MAEPCGAGKVGGFSILGNEIGALRDLENVVERVAASVVETVLVVGLLHRSRKAGKDVPYFFHIDAPRRIQFCCR
jgi:hypothetical protein